MLSHLFKFVNLVSPSSKQLSCSFKECFLQPLCHAVCYLLFACHFLNLYVSIGHMLFEEMVFNSDVFESWHHSWCCSQHECSIVVFEHFQICMTWQITSSQYCFDFINQSSKWNQILHSSSQSNIFCFHGGDGNLRL